MEATMSNNDKGDITEAFYSLDVYGNDGVSNEDVMTIFLGLGYQPIDVTLDELQHRRRRLDRGTPGTETRDVWTLVEIIRVLEQFSRFGHDTNATQSTAAQSYAVASHAWKATLFALVDTHDTGYITPCDVVLLSQGERHDISPLGISLAHAEQLVAHLVPSDDHGRMSRVEFDRFMSPLPNR